MKLLMGVERHETRICGEKRLEGDEGQERLVRSVDCKSAWSKGGEASLEGTLWKLRR